MANPFFAFKQFTVHHDQSALKVSTEACVFGALVTQRIAKSSEPGWILDIGSGSGLLALMLAQQTQKTMIEALEIDAAAAQQACQNFLGSPWSNRLASINTDVRTFSPKSGLLFDGIICNPPFFKNSMKRTNAARNRALHQVSLSFDDLAQAINRLLDHSGRCWIWYPPHEMQLFLELIGGLGWLSHHETRVIRFPDESPWRIMTELHWGENPFPGQQSFYMYEPDRSYSMEFIALLRPYYLFLDQ